MMASVNVRSNSIVQQASARLYKNRDTTGDIKFKIGDEEISAHKLILAAFSPKYERQFYGDFDDKDKQVIKVNEPCVSAAALKEFLQFFYLDEVKLTDENIEGVIFLAKESLVPEFYNECTKFLIEALTIENVCQSYRLAKLHECDELLKRCEKKIQMRSDVLKTQGFISCERTILSNTLKLVPASCKGTEMFEACTSWAKHFCAKNGKDAENNEDIREALGDNLYRIRFGTLTFEEFMGYYRSFKSLFTDEEREEILLMIGKVSDFKPKWFVTEIANTIPEWNEEAKEFFQICGTPKKTLEDVLHRTSFSCSRTILLREICYGPFRKRCSREGQKCVQKKLKIVEKNLNSVNEISYGKTLYSESCENRFAPNTQSSYRLQQPVLIEPNQTYEIASQFQRDVTLTYYMYTDERFVGNKSTIKFCDEEGFIAGFEFNILD